MCCFQCIALFRFQHKQIHVRAFWRLSVAGQIYSIVLNISHVFYAKTSNYKCQNKFSGVKYFALKCNGEVAQNENTQNCNYVQHLIKCTCYFPPLLFLPIIGILLYFNLHVHAIKQCNIFYTCFPAACGDT